MAGTQNAGSIVYEVDMDLDGFLRGQRRVSDSLNGMNRGFDASTRSINSTERSVNNAERSFSSLTKVAVALTAALSVQQVAQYADAWVTVNNKLANAIRPSEELADVTERVFDISQKTRSSLEATATLYARLERATRSAGTSTADLVTLTETINKGLAVSGATAEEASSTMVQLSQALASGVLRGEEFNSISENGSRLAVALSESLGVTVGQLRAMAAEGKLTTDVVVKGLLSQGNAIAKEFANTTMTMGQAFTTATNNITKFVGESSTIKSAYNGFNNTIVTLSDNLDTLATVFVGLAAIMGSRFAGALAMATAAKVKNTVASVASAKAAAEAAKSAELEAGAKLRVAQADKSAAVSALNVAQARLNTLKVTGASSVEEVKLANAEAATIRTQLAQIESEKALETTRLKAQITDQGRIATATRMAQLQQASSVLTTRLAAVEATASEAKAAAIVTAEAEVSAARITTATTTGAASAANGVYTASQKATVIATRAASASLVLLRGAMSLLGGPAGIVMIAAAALYFWYQKAEQAKKEAIAFADGLDALNASMKSMNNTQLKGTIADANESIIAQKSNIKDLQKEIESLRERYKNFTPEAQKVADSMGNGAAYASEMARVSRDLDKKVRDLANMQDKLAKTTDTASEANRLLTNNMLTSMGVHDGLIEKGSTLERVQGAVAKAFGDTADEINRANQAGQNFKPASLQVSPATGKGDKYISDLAEQNELLSIQDERLRAITKAGIDAAKVTDNPNQIARAKELAGSNFDLQKAEEARGRATKSAASETKKSATAAESVTQKLARLKQQSELAAGSTQELSRDQAILRAEQSLGKSATAAQIQQAKDYAAAIWDTSAALKARNAIPELKENADYSAQKSQLEMLKGAKDTNGELLISQEQYNQQSEQLEQEHQTNLAKIRADQAVTPQQAAAGTVDPVQQLANENAQKLALIQRFEANKTITEQQGLALRNAANMEYEQARIDAEWEIYRNQSQVNELLASSVDGFQSSASNAITGLINGTQNLQEAFSNIGTTILGSVVGALVEMGMQWVKSQLMGQAAAAASLASTMAQATAAASAWAPAAVSASIATYGTAAAIGQTAYAGSLLAAKGMAVAGARYNGGPVDANSMYRVGEKGKPEIYQASSGKQYMIPGDNGRVISNKDMQGSGGGGTSIQQEIHFNIQTTGGIDDATMAKMAQMMKQVSVSTIRDQQRPNGLLQKSR